MKKNILLIGGSYGIGQSLTELLKPNYNIWVASRSSNGIPAGVNHIVFDASSDVLDTTYLPDNLHGFVYLPGSINLKPFKMLSAEAFEADFQLNFMGMVKTLKTVLPKLAEGTSVVLFSTVAVGVGMPFHTSVAASKGALEGFSKSLAAEMAPKIRVNVIAPSLTDTPLAEKLLNNDAKREKMAERHPLKRVGTPEDIASVAAFLLSDQSTWITGQIIGVDGGISTLNIN